MSSYILGAKIWFKIVPILAPKKLVQFFYNFVQFFDLPVNNL